MRTNLPVTQREYEMADGETLVSTTDLQSHITYCNAAFIATSGFTRDELIGSPHNLVRHPDMPAEAFRDMWDTLKAGQPWSALVKNRRKDGDHYWVVANATPVVENGKVVGYMSVRTKPTRAQVKEAEALYARMREEAAAGRSTLRLHRGRLVHDTFFGRLREQARLGLTGRMVLAMAGLAVVSGAAGQWPWMDAGIGMGVKLGLLVCLTAGLAVWLRSAITRPLVDAVAVANRIAAGDLTQVVSTERRDEVGQVLRSMNQLNVNLQAVVGDVRSQVGSIHHASAEIAAGNQDLSGRTESQASSLQQTAASIEQLTGTVQQNADNANTASQLAGTARDVATRGSQAVAQVVATMEDIQASSKRIADITSVIDGIAFQTNILALNAAVEAARAGEQGRGFAVVAGEVRSLAQRSAEAAREIKGLIGASVDKVEAGSGLVQNAGRTMDEITASVDRVAQLIDTITLASGEQSNGIRQVNEAVAALDTTTQQNAALVEQSAAAAAMLRQQAEALTQTVSIFRMTGNVGATARSAPGAAGARPPAAVHVPAGASAPAPQAAPARTPTVPQPAAPQRAAHDASAQKASAHKASTHKASAHQPAAHQPAAPRAAAPRPAVAKPAAPAAAPPARQPAPAGDDDWTTF